jgi:diguanylate cyclase (GGDEF)-like protein/PAS domain S-box-containing protein
MRENAYRWYLGATVPVVAAYFALPQYHLWLWGTIGFGASIAVLVGSIRNRPSRRLPWILVASALATFAAGDTSYNVLTQYFHEANPFPSIADGFYLVTYALFAAGLLVMIRSRRAETDWGPLLDALIVTAGCGLLSWIYFIHPYVHAADMTVLQKVLSIAYPLGDILILAMLARLLAAGGRRNKSLALISFGAIGLLAADSVYGYIQLNGSWHVGGPTDLGWVAFYCLWGAAALHPSMRELTDVQPRREKQLSAVTLVVLSGVSLVAPLLTVWRDVVEGNTKDLAVIGVTSAVIFMLVMARLTSLAGVQAANAGRETALRVISERLVAAADLAEVFAAGIDGIQAITPGRKACLVTETHNHRSRVVAADHPGWDGLDVEIDATRSTVLGLDAPADLRWTVLPITGRVPRRFLVGADKDLPVATIPALKAISAQLALASERVELAHELHQHRSEQRFRSLVQSASDVIVVVHADGRLSCETPSLLTVLGYAGTVLGDRRIEDLLHPDDADRAGATIESMLCGHQSGPIRTQWRIRHADGRWLDMEVIANDLTEDPHVRGLTLTMRDVTDRMALEAELRHRAFHDSLTGLANRVLFRDRVDEALEHRARDQSAVAVVVVDLDDFKLVNDTMGHAAGDDLLIEVGRRMMGCLRTDDTVARIGGDEFAVCAAFPAGTREDADEIVQRIFDAFVEPCITTNGPFRVGLTMGVSLSLDESRRSNDMLREADLALYAAKRTSKGAFRMFEPGLHQSVLARLERRAELAEAIDHGDFQLLYQPIVRLVDGEIVGLEALVRWEHPRKGIISPDDFIAIAEESGLIVPLGRWVLERACGDLRRWQKSRPHVRMSVNVSPRQLQEPDFLDVVGHVLEAYGVDPSSLTFEITESALLQDSDEILQVLFGLRDRGIKLALDDFGTGYSSLSYLHRFPLQVLKIDRSFVSGTGSADGTLLDAIVAMAMSLNLDLVAEGIEEEMQLRRLQRLGCPNGQGYLFSRPVSVEAITAFLARGEHAFGRPTPAFTRTGRGLALVPDDSPRQSHAR